LIAQLLLEAIKQLGQPYRPQLGVLAKAICNGGSWPSRRNDYAAGDPWARCWECDRLGASTTVNSDGPPPPAMAICAGSRLHVLWSRGAHARW
jgi:hypothetical protein